MLKYVLLSACVALVASQQYYQDAKTAAIISEQRYQSGDGKHGAAYTQEDGIDFKEETDSDGTRHGSYSYIDPSGQKKTVSYTAGKNGFQATGDHLPVGPAGPPQAAPQPQYQPQQQYQPQYNQQAAAPQYRGNSNDYDDGQYDPRYNDPNFGAGNNPAPVQHYNPAPAPIVPQQPQYNPGPQYNQNHQAHFETTTPIPHRFLPPGKLSLSRTPDGYSYSFNKV